MQHLAVSDRCLAWLAYIHLIEFGELPVKFYDPANGSPSKIVKKEPFLIPWKTVEDVKTNPDMLLAVFEGNSTNINNSASVQGINCCFPYNAPSPCLNKYMHIVKT